MEAPLMERGPSARPVDPIGAKAAGAKKPPVVGRFAPTPSGRMHLGNVFSCLMAWLSAKSGAAAWCCASRTLIRGRRTPPSPIG